ncbi:hypothetical protein LX36DRAFT_657465 [Colletotrichum falcatum]|nr:hypothetical protein LX36DRAFT_657465 [Colletotrichum falcatum]
MSSRPLPILLLPTRGHMTPARTPVPFKIASTHPFIQPVSSPPSPTDICADGMRHCHCCGTERAEDRECNLPSRTCKTIDNASAVA